MGTNAEDLPAECRSEGSRAHQHPLFDGFTLFFLLTALLFLPQARAQQAVRLPDVSRDHHRPEELPGQEHHGQSLHPHEGAARPSCLPRLPRWSLGTNPQRQDRLRFLCHLPCRLGESDDRRRSRRPRQSQRLANLHHLPRHNQREQSRRGSAVLRYLPRKRSRAVPCQRSRPRPGGRQRRRSHLPELPRVRARRVARD